MRLLLTSPMFGDRSVLEALRAAGAAGYDGLEAWIEHLRQWDDDTAAIRRLAGELGLSLTVHGPSLKQNPTAEDPEERRCARTWSEWALRAGAELGANAVVIHPGHQSTPVSDVERCWIWQIEETCYLAELARSLGVSLAIELMENRPGELFTLAEHWHRLRAAVPGPNVGCTVDFAHAFTHRRFDEFVGLLPEAANVHVSDSAPHKTHLPLGQGQVDLPAVARVLRERGTSAGGEYPHAVVVEGKVETGREATARANREYWRRLESSSELDSRVSAC